MESEYKLWCEMEVEVYLRAEDTSVDFGHEHLVQLEDAIQLELPENKEQSEALDALVMEEQYNEVAVQEFLECHLYQDEVGVEEELEYEMETSIEEQLLEEEEAERAFWFEEECPTLYARSNLTSPVPMLPTNSPVSDSSSNACLLSSLPHEIFLEITSFLLHPSCLSVLSMVCRSFYRMVHLQNDTDDTTNCCWRQSFEYINRAYIDNICARESIIRLERASSPYASFNWKATCKKFYLSIQNFYSGRFFLTESELDHEELFSPVHRPQAHLANQNLQPLGSDSGVPTRIVFCFPYLFVVNRCFIMDPDRRHEVRSLPCGCGNSVLDLLAPFVCTASPECELLLVGRKRRLHADQSNIIKPSPANGKTMFGSHFVVAPLALNRPASIAKARDSLLLPSPPSQHQHQHTEVCEPVGGHQAFFNGEFFAVPFLDQEFDLSDNTSNTSITGSTSTSTSNAWLNIYRLCSDNNDDHELYMTIPRPPSHLAPFSFRGSTDMNRDFVATSCRHSEVIALGNLHNKEVHYVWPYSSQFASHQICLTKDYLVTSDPHIRKLFFYDLCKGRWRSKSHSFADVAAEVGDSDLTPTMTYLCGDKNSNVIAFKVVCGTMGVRVVLFDVRTLRTIASIDIGDPSEVMNATTRIRFEFPFAYIATIKASGTNINNNISVIVVDFSCGLLCRRECMVRLDSDTIVQRRYSEAEA